MGGIYDLGGSGFHQCRQANKQGQGGEPLTVEKVDARLRIVEKMIDALLTAGTNESTYV